MGRLHQWVSISTGKLRGQLISHDEKDVRGCLSHVMFYLVEIDKVDQPVLVKWECGIFHAYFEYG